MANTTINSSGVTFPDGTTQGTSGAPFIKGQAFTSNGTFTIPTGVTALKVTVVGGGGGGGGTAKAEQILKDFAYSMCEGSMCFMVQYIVCYIACYIVYNIARKLCQYIACYIVCYITYYITSKSCYMTYHHMMCYM